MKVTKSYPQRKASMENLRIGPIGDLREELNDRKEVFGRAWHRAEDRMADNRSKRQGVRESPRKKEQDLRNKLKRSLKSYDHRANEDQVTFSVPKFDAETDEDVLNRREKQISYGKNTVDYDRYSLLVHKTDRTDTMPRTPNKHRKYSRRQWDGLVKNWKQRIHQTVATLEGREEESGNEDWKLDGRLSAGSSWADEVEDEEGGFRCRTTSSASSDQGLGHSSVSSCGEETPVCFTPGVDSSMEDGEFKDGVFEVSGMNDYIDA